MSVISLTTMFALNGVDIGDLFQQSLKIEHTVEAHSYKNSSRGEDVSTF